MNRENAPRIMGWVHKSENLDREGVRQKAMKADAQWFVKNMTRLEINEANLETHDPDDPVVWVWDLYAPMYPVGK